MIVPFELNPCQQLSFQDSLCGLANREKKYWRSRFYTPVNVIIGVLIIKEMVDILDDEVVENLMPDLYYQYTLHASSFEEQIVITDGAYSGKENSDKAAEKNSSYYYRPYRTGSK